MFNVYDLAGRWVSGFDADKDDTREQLEEQYAKQCGWDSAEHMKKYYPLENYTFSHEDRQYKQD